VALSLQRGPPHVADGCSPVLELSSADEQKRCVV
jgi:hypothetical protein